MRTSNICRDMDGHVFKRTELETGLTAPPFHVYCRTTTVPYFDDMDDIAERIARGADGKTYNVPATMTYHEWYRKYVVALREKEYNEKVKETLLFVKENYAKKIRMGMQNKHIRKKCLTSVRFYIGIMTHPKRSIFCCSR